MADLDLMNVIEKVESSGWNCSVRFEPGFLHMLSGKPADRAVINIAKYNNCNHETALEIASMSFGLYQVMGYNIYLLGYDQSLINWWSCKQAQQVTFDTFLTAHGINYTWAQLMANPDLLTKFAKTYNGDAEEYSQAMKNAATRLGLIK